ncbi:glutathione S-transferase GstA [Hypoxylon fragiforme]|uniref:glutathione S-transferase GstA n=1 Tax=Hypoxylon fragiforme TaxID=63214 RepID=UPI0020C6D625|nr:glutathione S-transferase GstA [Hypoxylon fragiforme]KAI2607613.1 glutathione S-transferase GstA [Hypoxylon fragiforme]
MTTFPPEKAPKPGLNIYGYPAVNPYKLTIAAEELGIPYNYITVNIRTELESEWYLSINPNGRVPAIVHVKDDGTSATVFESGACLLYIAAEFDKEHKISHPVGTPEYWAQLSWLSWQISGQGPMLGQAAHFNRYAPEPVPYGSWRYTAEARRLHTVLDKQLSKTPYLTGPHPTIADIATFIYAHSSAWIGLPPPSPSEFPHIATWRDRLLARPGFRRGLESPVPYPFSDDRVTREEGGEGQEFYVNVRRWGSRGIRSATERWWREGGGRVLGVPSDGANLGGVEGGEGGEGEGGK